MKTVSNDYAAQFPIDGVSADGPFDGFPFDRIGDDLRHLYDEVIASDVPHSLMQLAEAIDARRSGQSSE
ncbi:NepR family anti-sigma factor [Methylobacterium brachythecii]|nr:NepR family anti-sigma factor [Methylobacterium brachythecii]